MQLLTSGLAGAFTDQEISEEQLAEIRKKDVLNEMMSELGEAMPVLKTVLIDERDSYITQKMIESKGKKIVSVVGAGHMGGIKEGLLNNKKTNLEEIEQIPPASSVAKIIGWAIPERINVDHTVKQFQDFSAFPAAGIVHERQP